MDEQEQLRAALTPSLVNGKRRNGSAQGRASGHLRLVGPPEHLLDIAQSHPSLTAVDGESYAELLIFPPTDSSSSSLTDAVVVLEFPSTFQGIAVAGAD